MSSVPREVLEDVLLPLDRWTLDAVQFTNRRFLQLILERMPDVCLREIKTASFRASKDNTHVSSYRIRIDLLGTREISNAHMDASYLFSKFMQALRSSRVVGLTLERIVFTPALATLVLETPTIVTQLSISGGSCAQLTPKQFHEVLLHFSPSSLRVSACHFRACQISDELVRALINNRLECISFPDMAPVDGGSFSVTDDAIVDFCMQPDVQVDREGDAPKQKFFGELYLYNGSFTKDLFKRLVEASRVSTRTQPFRIVVSPVRVEDEDLRDFLQTVSYRRRGSWGQMRIYDFPGQVHEAVAAVHLQIVLNSDDRLEMLRGQRPGPYFH